jgi:hypothetical protein
VNRTVLEIVRAVAEGKVTIATMQNARRVLERELAPAPAKAPIPSVKHHEAFAAELERELEEVSRETWDACLARTRVDHRGRGACESCHRERELEPHHLEMGSGNRTDAAHLVMALCADCHRLAPSAAHRRVRWFAVTVVIPWAKAHSYPLPNRKEYRDAQ